MFPMAAAAALLCCAACAPALRQASARPVARRLANIVQHIVQHTRAHAHAVARQHLSLASEHLARLRSVRRPRRDDTEMTKATPSPAKRSAADEESGKSKQPRLDDEEALETWCPVPSAAFSKGVPQTLLEEGKIDFLFRTKVGLKPEDVHPDLDDVQRFHILLQPMATSCAHIAKLLKQEAPDLAAEYESAAHTLHHATPTKQQGGEQGGGGGGGAGEGEMPGSCSVRPAAARLITIGKKHLPSQDHYERFFAFTSASSAVSVDEVTKGLGERKYNTATRGERVQPAAVVAGTGVYSLCARTAAPDSDRVGGFPTSANNVLLAYKLELPLTEGDFQRELNIGKEGVMVVMIKNPSDKGSRPANIPTIKEVPGYSQAQLDLFRGRRWLAPVDPRMLDQVGTEMVLVGESTRLSASGIGAAAAAHLAAFEHAHVQAVVDMATEHAATLTTTIPPSAMMAAAPEPAGAPKGAHPSTSADKPAAGGGEALPESEGTPHKRDSTKVESGAVGLPLHEQTPEDVERALVRDAAESLKPLASGLLGAEGGGGGDEAATVTRVQHEAIHTDTGAA